jgi:hypothetical protein
MVNSALFMLVMDKKEEIAILTQQNHQRFWLILMSRLSNLNLMEKNLWKINLKKKVKKEKKGQSENKFNAEINILF